MKFRSILKLRQIWKLQKTTINHANSNDYGCEECCNYCLINFWKIVRCSRRKRKYCKKYSITTSRLVILTLNSITSECISMNSMYCFKMCDSDLLTFTFSLIDCRLLIMSSANESANVNIPNARVRKHVNVRHDKTIIKNCINTTMKHAKGLFQSNGNLSICVSEILNLEYLKWVFSIKANEILTTLGVAIWMHLCPHPCYNK